MSNLVDLSNISLCFKGHSPLFSGLDWQIPDGSFSFLMGKSGAGKSTLLRMMYLDLRPDLGTMHIFGQNVAHLSQSRRSALRRKIGVVFQDFRLVPHMTAVENVALPLKVEGVELRRRTHQAQELLDWVGLSGHMNEFPASLSGGQQQRVAIARAVIHRPHLLLADEPTGNVDDTVALRLIYLLEQLHKAGTTVIVATHNTQLAQMFQYPLFEIQAGQMMKISPSALAEWGGHP